MGKLKNTIRGRILEQIVSRPDPKARQYGLNRLRRKPPTLELYFEPGDPHSHLTLQALGKFAERLHCPIKVLIVPPPEAAAYPEADKQRAFALLDAQRVAPAWALSFPPSPQLPSDDTKTQATEAFVAAGDDLYALLSLETETRAALFSGKTFPPQSLSKPNSDLVNTTLVQSAARRSDMGHYLPAMWQFDGEWFWGIDRFDFLQQRLQDWNALDGTQPLLSFDANNAAIHSTNADELEFYFSFRSPYSYIAAEYVLKHFKSWPVPVKVKPVLPMAMRGLPVPFAKRLYIVRDVKRCASRDGYPFGRIADPIGAGAERALTVFNLCEGTEQQLQFLAAAGRAAFAQSTDLATDEGLLHASRQAGLDDVGVLAKLKQGMDLAFAEKNRQDLFTNGLWGVPSWKLGEFVTWGYDRRWMLESLFRNRT